MKMVEIFLEFLDRRVEEFGGAQYKTFGIFGVINYPLGYFILCLLGADESIISRLVATLMSLPLIFVQRWPKNIKKYLNLYWFLTLLCSIPVFATYTLLKNHASTEWLLNFSIGIFILLLIVDYILFLTLYILGILLGYSLFLLTGQEVIFQVPAPIIYIYSAMLVLGCVFSRRKEIVQQQKLATLRALAAAVAHEMRTPLFALSTIAYALKRDLPDLIKFYDVTKGNLDAHQLKFIAEAPQSIEETNRSAFSFIDILLMNLKEDFKEKPTTIYQMRKCIEESMRTYPFGEDERELVHYGHLEDFKFIGNDLLVKHVLFNLLKNALYYVRAANKGNITVTTEIQKDFNKLHFKDTGKGIPASILPHIFDKFYSKTKYGTGIGLAFCKMVMENLGGDITCHSIEGEFTEFTLIFPVIKES